jgi:ABC-2 type transport system permease protein
MPRLFSSLAIDPVQWRALVRVSLRNDLRMSGRAFDVSGRARGANAAIGTLLTLVAMGGGAAIFLTVSHDLFLASTLFLFLLAFVIGSSLLIEYQSIVLSPADHRQLSFQPVTSRTFLAARITSVLVYVLAMTAAFCLAPLVAFFFLRTGGPLVAAAALASAVVEAIVVTLVVIGGYVTVLTFVPAARLTRALSYVQLVFSFFIYGSYLIVPRFLSGPGFVDTALPRAAWVLVNPTSWFAGWIVLASGERTPFMATAAALSVAAMVASLWLVSGRLSIDYAERLADVDTTPAGGAGKAARPLRAGWLFANGEARAVAVLVRAQFRYDNRFRLTVLSILPLTLVYMFGGFGEGGLDPFDGQRQGHSLVYMAVMMFPPMLRGALTQSEAFRAAWIFHGTPADKRALVLALRSFVAVAFLAPYLAFVGAVYVAVVGRPLMVALHVVLLGLFSHLLLVLDLMMNPDVPFSRPSARGARTWSTFLSIMAAVLVGTTLHFVLIAVYSSTFAIVFTLTGLVALTIVAELALRLRLESAAAGAQFDL